MLWRRLLQATLLTSLLAITTAIKFLPATRLLLKAFTTNNITSLLLGGGADVNFNVNHDLPLSEVAKLCNMEIVKALLLRCPDAPLVNTASDLPLSEAAKLCNMEIVKALLLRCPDAPIVNTASGRTAAHEAALLGCSAVAAVIDDKLAGCSRCPNRCVRCPVGTMDYVDRLGLQGGHRSLPSGVVGNTTRLPCPASGYVTWTCSENGSWVRSELSTCLDVATTSIELTTDSTDFPPDSRELSTSTNPFPTDSSVLFTSTDLYATETSSFSSDTTPSPSSDTDTTPTDSSSVSLVDSNTFTSSNSTSLTTPETSSVSNITPATYSFTPSTDITTEDDDTSIYPDRSGNASSVVNSWNQTNDVNNEGIPMDQEDVKNIIEKLKSLELKFKKDFQKVQEYMQNVLQVLDRSDPHRWRDVNTTIRALASTKLQDSLNKASLAIASLPSNYTNFTRSYPSNISNSSIIRQYPSYFTALRRRHQHHSFNQTSIELPVNFHQNYIDDDGLITVLFHSFDGLHCATNSVPCDPDKANISEVQADRQINSPIIGATVRNNSIWKSPEGDVARMKLQHIYLGDRYNLGSATCVWWNNSINGWSTEGCWLEEQTDHYTICVCDHLTNLAVMMDIYGVLDSHLHVYLHWITVIGCSVSVICLLLTLICLSLALTSAKKHSGQGMSKIHIHLYACLCAAELVLLCGLDATHSPVLCTVVAALLHYLFLATFTWCAIEGFNLYLMLGKVFATFNPLKYYMIVGYGFPLLFVGITLAATQAQGYGTARICWLEPGNIIWTFAGPVLLIMMCNMVSFIFAVRVACRRQTQGGPQRPPVKMRGSLALFLILGLTWSSGFLYAVKGNSRLLAFVFTVLNSLQGLGIFMTTVLMNERLIKDLRSVQFIRRLHNAIRGRKHAAQDADQDSQNQLNLNCTVEMNTNNQ
ncbi:adhesion G protein-coupled receptor L4 [Procambarus clarkii]|uniref:adhesion G protein-coupled receptor L4 n=1 Tax=Procambarus clarkii TaxID=6728 RepID=UPI003744072F